MKILYVASSAIPSQAANSVHVAKMAQALARQGHDVVIISPEYARNTAPPCELNDIYTYYGVEHNFKLKQASLMFKGSLGLFLYAFQALYYSFLCQPDIIYSRCLYSALVLNLFGLRVVCERHDILPSNKLQRLFRWTCGYKPFLKTVVISQALKNFYVKEYGLQEDRVLVAPDAADAISSSQTTPIPKDHSSIDIGYSGHLYQGRGIDLIGKAAIALPHYNFHIVGGQAEDVEYWKGEFSSCGNLTFYGHVFPSKVPAYLMSFDILLAPYQYKVSISGKGGDTSRWMSPLKIFEYMSSGKPIICSDIPVLREVLSHGNNCLLCQPDSIEEWIAAIEKLANDRALAKKIGDNALGNFIKNYTWESRAKCIVESINESLKFA